MEVRVLGIEIRQIAWLLYPWSQGSETVGCLRWASNVLITRINEGTRRDENVLDRQCWEEWSG